MKHASSTLSRGILTSGCKFSQALVVALAFLAGGAARAQEDRRPVVAIDKGAKELPLAFDKAVPESVKDLVDIQDHVKSILAKAIGATVGVRIGPSQGSGVIISKDGYVLTAGHVSGTPDRECQIILPDGRKLKGKTLGWNKNLDSGMIKITESGDFPFSEMAPSADLKKGTWCMAIGHPNGILPGRSPVVRLGRVQETSKTFVRTDCTLVGGDSGGPLFDMHGRVIGIHSRIGPPITANIHVPVDTYHETWERLVRGDEWPGKGDPYLGVRFDGDSATNLKVASVSEGSPAEKAGLKENDEILSVDGKKFEARAALISMIQTKRPGNEISIVVRRGEETLTIRVTLGKRPTE